MRQLWAGCWPLNALCRNFDELSFQKATQLQENTALQEEMMRLGKKLSVSGSLTDADVLRETIGSSERLLAEKQEVMF